jgi:hypothetical protein
VFNTCNNDLDTLQDEMLCGGGCFVKLVALRYEMFCDFFPNVLSYTE